MRQKALTDGVNRLIIVLCLILVARHDGVAGGEVEHYHVVEPYISQSFHAPIVPVGPLYVALAIQYGKGVLREWHGERGLRDARTIAQLAHTKVVTGEKRLL